MIVDKIDGDKDGQVTFEELEKWINHVGKKYIYDDVDRVWSHYDRDEDGYISFDNYKEESYDSITSESSNRILICLIHLSVKIQFKLKVF